MSLVFLAGPLSGLIVQPLIGLLNQSPFRQIPPTLADCRAGVMADKCKSRFGRRRPFIVASVAICSMGLILLGFTRNFASIITTWGSPTVCNPLPPLFRRPCPGHSLEFQNDALTIWLAVFAIYCIDFSINAGEFSTCLYLSMFILGEPDKAISASCRSCPYRRYPSSC